jgi:OFA family oxalate/formate antiporter-like MFS transporter
MTRSDVATTGMMPRATPWIQLGLGIICMCMIANLQFGWTAFVPKLIKNTHWTLTAVQWSFTIFVLVETWLVPFEAALVDRFGPRLAVIVGGIFAALGWVCNGQLHSLPGLYLGGALAGIGAGMVYATCVPNAVKWFAANRGLAVGLTVAGFGAGAAVTVTPLVHMIQTAGPFPTFTFFGLAQGAVIILCGFFLVSPPRATTPAMLANVRCLQGTHDYTLLETLRSPVFWLLYAVFILIAAPGLMFVAQIAPVATAFHLAAIPVHVALWTAPVLLLTLQLNNIVGGISRISLGWISDRVGRERTLAVAFSVEGVGVWAFSRFGHTPVAFILLSALVFFAWGEIYSIFPALIRDHFGQRYAATNYGVLYTAKGVASLLVPISSAIAIATGSWTTVFYLAAVMNIVAAFLAIAVLWPLRLREVSRDRALQDEALAYASSVA